MPGRLAIDFGTSNTVAALWDESQGAAVPLILPDYSRSVAVAGAQGGFGDVPVIPSLIYYKDDQRWIGQQIFDEGRYDHLHTFRWMKRFINRRLPIALRRGERDFTADQAGRDFLSAVLTVAAAGVEMNPAEEEIALTVPVESYEHYDQWLISVAESAGLPRVRLIDEASAAALGYGAHVQVGDVFLVFDFGGGTMDVSVVLVEEEQVGDEVLRRCRVLGKAGADLGGVTIDQWIFQDVLRRAAADDGTKDVRRISRKLLVDCERAKEQLSVEEKVEVSALDVFTGYSLGAEYTRGQFEQMLEERGLFTTIDATVQRALAAARERGYDDEHISAVFMIGGSSVIPSVQQALTRIFGGERVMIDRPLEAVACGAAAFVAGVNVINHIQHDYAIRYINTQTGTYGFRPVVRRGTQYPTAEPVAKVLVKASDDRQAKLGIAVFEVGGENGRDGANVELIFDQSGAARVRPVTPEEDFKRSHFWVNEAAPTFLSNEPPGAQGEARFEVHLGIDANRRLVLSAKDVKSGAFVYRDVPVVKLS